MRQILKVPWFVFRLLITGVSSQFTVGVAAQSFSDVYTFSGVYPGDTLILSNDTLYGTAAGDVSMVFSIKSDGSSFLDLHFFYSPTISPGYYSDTGLVLNGGTLFGTTHQGIYPTNSGTIFGVNIDGSGFTNLHTFSTDEGANLAAGLTLSGSTLYGTASEGGSSGSGTLFAINTDGTGFRVLYTFTPVTNGTNTDGFYPSSELVVTGDTIYGTAAGGPGGSGTIFTIHTNGSGFNVLHSFTQNSTNSLGNYTNTDGIGPNGLMISGNLLYGTARSGGNNGHGTVFAMDTNGTGFSVLYTFAAGNSDGATPWAGLLLSNDTLFGTTSGGGPWGNGTVFALNTNGTGFTVFHSFSQQVPPVGANSEGANPLGKLIMSGHTLYGTASRGGSWGYGTIFSISLLPELKIVFSPNNVVLSWPTNVGGFDYSGLILQSTMDFSASSTWTNVSLAPVVINGQNTVTNPISGTRQFFRLSQ